MRWRHHGRGWISPLQFVPIAEESDLIHPLGEFALTQSCRQARRWERSGYGPLRIAVNISARQFRNPGFVPAVERALRAADLDPGRLDLELTEGVLVEKREEAVEILQRLKALGVKIAVDDFGTGYSSLSYLSRLPLDCLKIDRSFVNRVHEHGHDAAIAEAVISLAHSLGLRVVAEGVETTEQMGFLSAHGCDEGQGHLYSPAVRAEVMASLLANGSLSAGRRTAVKHN
jgi:EAL domain-containing protein (putative c-di-GMP-specific phosphodiesterase class I)